MVEVVLGLLFEKFQLCVFGQLLRAVVLIL